jgi:hypothetical protein
MQRLGLLAGARLVLIEKDVRAAPIDTQRSLSVMDR